MYVRDHLRGTATKCYFFKTIEMILSVLFPKGLSVRSLEILGEPIISKCFFKAKFEPTLPSALLIKSI